MRLKTFTAGTMSEAMASMRIELGENAIILSTQDGADAGGVTITGAVESPAPATMLSDLLADDGADPLDVIDEALRYHRVPPEIADHLMATAGSVETDNTVARLASALDTQFRFKPIEPAAIAGPLMLVGPSGSGKSVSAAKIAAATLLAGRTVRLVTTDVERAGAAERLAALAERFGIPLERAPDIAAVSHILDQPPDALLVIDTPGMNPFAESELDMASAIAGLGGVEPALVLAAGGDAMEMAELAAAFSGLGATRMIATRLDAASRYGSLLAAAHAARLPFGAGGIRPNIGNGLVPVNPMSLARLLLAHPGNGNAPTASPKVSQ